MAKNKVLHDPIAYKSRSTSKFFVAPTKEQATTGRFMDAGDNYGVGFDNPVGTTKVKSMAEGPIPQESVCFRCEDAIRKP